MIVWHRRRLNETLDEHDMRMDSGPPRNVLAALHRENEREEAESAMLPTSRSSSNNGRENAVGTVRTAHHVGGRNAVGSARTVGGRIVSGPPQNSRIEGSAASAAASNVAAGSGGRDYPRGVSGGYVGGCGRSGRGESGRNYGGHGAGCSGGRGGPLPSRNAPGQGNRSILLEEDLVNYFSGSSDSLVGIEKGTSGTASAGGIVLMGIPISEMSQIPILKMTVR